MMYDPGSPAAELFKLYPIGIELGISEKPVPPPLDSDQIYIDGHLLGEPFQSIYAERGVMAYGKPLSEMIYNRVRRRYEQYFEGVAFYQMADSGEIGLLAYGSFICGESCQQVDIKNGVLDYSYMVAPVFKEFVKQHGIIFTGFPLGDLVSLKDQSIQVFQNVVLVSASPWSPDSVQLLPISEDLGLISQNPRTPSSEDQMYFYSTSEGIGFDIPTYFWDYLVAHGGLQTSGPPITHLETISEGVLRQCFENLCLLYDKSSFDEPRVYPVQLGYQYLGLKGYQEHKQTQEPDPTLTKLSLQVEEEQPTIQSNQRQEIRVLVSRDGAPVSGIEMEITITLPDKVTQTYQLPKTGPDGRASILLPLFQVDNGSVILYQVCVIGQEQTYFCYEDSFTIWNQW